MITMFRPLQSALFILFLNFITIEGNPVHSFLNSNDLKKIFRVDLAEKVGNYEISSIAENRINKRDVLGEKIISLKIKTSDGEFVIELHPNHQLIHDDLGEHHELREGIYQGRVVSPVPGKAGLTNFGNGYNGLIITKHKTYAIHSLPDYLHKHFENEHDDPQNYHFVVPINAEDEHESQHYKNRYEDVQEFVKSQDLEHLVRRKRQTNSLRYMDLLIALDDTYDTPSSIDNNLRRLTNMLSLLNSVQTIFTGSTLQNKIILSVKRFDLISGTNNPSPGPDEDIGIYLTSFCSYQRTVAGIDNSILMTGQNLQYQNSRSTVGLAYVSGTCDPTARCGVVEDLDTRTEYVIAHEVGHNIGMGHDCDNDCECTNTIMAPFVTVTNNWSPCSNTEFNTFLGSTSCLNNFESSNVNSDTSLDVQARASMDAFCNVAFPGSTAVEDGVNDPCVQLRCNNNGAETNAGFGIPDGSPCTSSGEVLCTSGSCPAIVSTTTTSLTTTTSSTTTSSTTASTTSTDATTTTTTDSITDSTTSTGSTDSTTDSATTTTGSTDSTTNSATTTTGSTDATTTLNPRTRRRFWRRLIRRLQRIFRSGGRRFFSFRRRRFGRSTSSVLYRFRSDMRSMKKRDVDSNIQCPKMPSWIHVPCPQNCSGVDTYVTQFMCTSKCSGCLHVYNDDDCGPLTLSEITCCN